MLVGFAGLLAVGRLLWPPTMPSNETVAALVPERVHSAGQAGRDASRASVTPGVVVPDMHSVPPAALAEPEASSQPAGDAFAVQKPPAAPPPATPHPSVLNVAPVAAAPQPQAPRLRAIGYYEDATGRMAFLEIQEGTKMVRIGSSVLDGLQVTEITPKQVTLVNRATGQTSRLSLDNH
jgi:hypothetical protein